jgi:hypothetical protein
MSLHPALYLCNCGEVFLSIISNVVGSYIILIFGDRGDGAALSFLLSVKLENLAE